MPDAHLDCVLLYYIQVIYILKVISVLYCVRLANIACSLFVCSMELCECENVECACKKTSFVSEVLHLTWLWLKNRVQQTIPHTHLLHSWRNKATHIHTCVVLRLLFCKKNCIGSLSDVNKIERRKKSSLFIWFVYSVNCWLQSTYMVQSTERVTKHKQLKIEPEDSTGLQL